MEFLKKYLGQKSETEGLFEQQGKTEPIVQQTEIKEPHYYSVPAAVGLQTDQAVGLKLSYPLWIIQDFSGNLIQFARVQTNSEFVEAFIQDDNGKVETMQFYLSALRSGQKGTDEIINRSKVKIAEIYPNSQAWLINKETWDSYTTRSEREKALLREKRREENLEKERKQKAMAILRVQQRIEQENELLLQQQQQLLKQEQQVLQPQYQPLPEEIWLSNNPTVQPSAINVPQQFQLLQQQPLPEDIWLQNIRTVQPSVINVPQQFQIEQAQQVQPSIIEEQEMHLAPQIQILPVQVPQIQIQVPPMQIEANDYQQLVAQNNPKQIIQSQGYALSGNAPESVYPGYVNYRGQNATMQDALGFSETNLGKQFSVSNIHGLLTMTNFLNAYNATNNVRITAAMLPLKNNVGYGALLANNKLVDGANQNIALRFEVHNSLIYTNIVARKKGENLGYQKALLILSKRIAQQLKKTYKIQATGMQAMFMMRLVDLLLNYNRFGRASLSIMKFVGRFQNIRTDQYLNDRAQLDAQRVNDSRRKFASNIAKFARDTGVQLSAENLQTTLNSFVEARRNKMTLGINKMKAKMEERRERLAAQMGNVSTAMVNAPRSYLRQQNPRTFGGYNNPLNPNVSQAMLALQ